MHIAYRCNGRHARRHGRAGIHGGIGENAVIRARIIAGLSFLPSFEILVIPANEERSMAGSIHEIFTKSAVHEQQGISHIRRNDLSIAWGCVKPFTRKARNSPSPTRMKKQKPI